MATELPGLDGVSTASAIVSERRVPVILLTGYVGPEFFLSSRRRHTISDRDWSSDVCSSDLSLRGEGAAAPSPRRDPVRPGNFPATLLSLDRICLRPSGKGTCSDCFRRSSGAGASLWVRSEEGLLGEECGFRWASDHYKKKKT